MAEHHGAPGHFGRASRMIFHRPTHRPLQAPAQPRLWICGRTPLNWLPERRWERDQ